MAATRVAQADRHIVALDLDGTVLFHDSTFEPELGAAIRALHEAGHEVVVSTGRSVDATLPVVEQLRIRPEWVICSNGAVTLRRDPLAERSYRREYVEAFDATDVLQRIRSHLVTARFAVEVTDGTFLYTEPIPAGTLPAAQRQVSFDELLGVQATRVVVVSPDHHLEDFLQVVESMGLVNVAYAVGWTAWLDIAPEGVNKASALEVVAARLGIDRSRVFAAGDGQNDIDMLRWVARHGDAVAMGQATAEVKAVASRVTGTVEEIGLLAALRDRFAGLL
ncbi:HAD-IIB family hydrolase [Leucobacter sp. CSA1]|uniref:HAD-IIB family hydrolase n=1 Tax=Leucobacter chromiisoli TaxID=2796471 RepID=A0A934QA30_9MICO|nr:HAD-IIB family hydrolase [Leucobacter chromiisoli]MBK0419394.1 HAD-IIB family hydrolase [Leucobacter chromiisoli]